MQSQQTFGGKHKGSDNLVKESPKDFSKEENNLEKRKKPEDEASAAFAPLSKSISAPEPASKRLKRGDGDEDFQNRIMVLDT